MSESFALVSGFIAIAITLVWQLWLGEFMLPFKVGITLTTTVWLVTTSIAVMNGVAA